MGLCFGLDLKAVVIMWMFLLLLSTADTEPRPILVLTHSRLWVHQELQRDKARTADSN